MPTMQEVRAKFPQYNDMSDDQLAAALHRKFYSDMPFEDFAAKVGLTAPQTVADGKGDRERSWGETAQDVVASGAQGFQSGFQSLLGSVGDSQEMTGNVLAWGAGKLGFSPETQQVARSFGQRIPTMGLNIKAPTSEQVNNAFESVIGKYQPETDAGRYTAGVGEFVPAAMSGPGSLVRKTAMSVIPGVVTTFTGDVTDQNPYAKAGAGIIASVATAGRGNAGTKEMYKAVVKDGADYVEANKLPKMKPLDAAAAAVKAKADETYTALRAAGIKYDANGIDQTISATGQIRINPKLAPMAEGLREEFAKFQGRGMDFQDLDELEQLGASIMRDRNVSEADRMLTGAVLSKIRSVRDGAIATNGSIPANEVKALVKTAKDYGRRNILARDIKGMEKSSEWYLGGDESGLRNKFSSYGKKNYQNLSPKEESAYKSVVQREGILNPLHNLGSRLGQIATGSIAANMGGPIAAIGSVVGTTLARKVMEMYTKAGVEKAIKTVLAGRSAQEQAAVRDLISRYEAQARLALTADAAIRQNMPETSPALSGVPR